MIRLPRLVIAAPASGQGKTTVATGLMAALSRAGHDVSGHKVGPDYIDPGYHALACGRPGRNLDPHLVGEDRVVPLLLHGAATPRRADVAVIEGVMGLYDGRIGGDGFASTAHVAALTRSPVVLVVDISGASRSVAAVVHGMATFDDTVTIAGVILNKAGSPRHAGEVVSSMARTGIPVLGILSRNDAVSAPSRHLGLVPAAERDEAAHALDLLAAQVAEHVDLEAVLAIARSAPELQEAAWDAGAEVGMPVSADRTARPVVAMAGGRAFTFRYPETEELLRAAGCEPVTFDPLTDTALPVGTAGIYLGGGFPEVHAVELTANASLLADLRDAVAAGVPTVAECAGLLYLCRTVDDATMVGALEATAAMTPKLTLRYPTVVAVSDSLLTRTGEQVTGHEFHRTQVTPASGAQAAWSIDGDAVGFASPTLHASYLHTHWAGHPHLARRFATAVHAHHGQAAGSNPGDPLRHHGDAEVRGEELVDLAVNVYAGPRPPWLDAALHASLDEVGHYPSSAPAEADLARHHAIPAGTVLATAGAAEAFGLVARLRPWRRPVVVHPQFTEPHAALGQAGHEVTAVVLPRPFELDPALVPDDADLVVLGNPTNPTGVLHPAATIRALLRPGRLVVVDEAFMDAAGEAESLLRDAAGPDGVGGGLLVVRSLTKHWSIPGVRAGYAVGSAALVTELRRGQVPWSVSTTAAAAMSACATPEAAAESTSRTQMLATWRTTLEKGLADLGVDHVPSSASFVLARVGDGVHAALRHHGIGVRRGDTFPGLGPDWVRIAVRPPEVTAQLLTALGSLDLGSPDLGSCAPRRTPARPGAHDLDPTHQEPTP